MTHQFIPGPYAVKDTDGTFIHIVTPSGTIAVMSRALTDQAPKMLATADLLASSEGMYRLLQDLLAGVDVHEVKTRAVVLLGRIDRGAS